MSVLCLRSPVRVSRFLPVLESPSNTSLTGWTNGVPPYGGKIRSPQLRVDSLNPIERLLTFTRVQARLLARLPALLLWQHP